MGFHIIKNTHQFYRDYFTRNLSIKTAHPVLEKTIRGAMNISDILNSNFENNSEKEKATAICLANLALDSYWEGKNTPLPKNYTNEIIRLVTSILREEPNTDNLVLSIQLLFRVREINSAFTLIADNIVSLEENHIILKIILITYLFEKNYDEALKITEKLIKNSNLINDDWLTMVLIVCSIYKAGGIPDSYIDFRSLIDNKEYTNTRKYNTIINHSENKKTTALIACDPIYYYEHTVPLIYSIYETNKELLNIHIHLYNPNKEIEDNIKFLQKQLTEINISSTSEFIEIQQGIKVHYACNRYIIAKHLLEKIKSPILILDADALFRTKIPPFLQDMMASSDVVATSSEFAPFWEKHLGGFVYLNNTEQSFQYINSVSRFIKNNLEQQNTVWFLDQIALSASTDYIKNINLQTIASSLVYDINHTDNSIVWMVTTAKNNKKFNEFKKSLISKHTSKYLHKYNNDNFYYFIEIGTSDFDTLTEKLDSTKKGICIDPISLYLNNLQDKENHFKVQAAISNENKKTSVFYIHPETIETLQLPAWLRGCKSINTIHPAINSISENYQIEIDNLITIENIETITFDKVYDDFKIKNLYLLKIDTEGHDHIIIKDIFKDGINKSHPHIIEFESNHLTKTKDFNEILISLINLGYDLISSDRVGGNASTKMQLNLQRIIKKSDISESYINLAIEGYLDGYNLESPPHDNTLESALSYCLKNNGTGVTYKNGKFEVRAGEYLIDNNDSISWVIF